MNILFTGGGKAGSWKIRGEQLGRAIGADVIQQALDVAAYDMVVVVKRPRGDLLERIQRAGVPMIWDVVDAWPQPDGNTWSREECLGWLDQQITRMRPAAIVAATRAMAADVQATRPGLPVIALPHHGRPGLKRRSISALRTVGYEGSVNHLGEQWTRLLSAECGRRGWQFVVNPPSISDLDVVVALRQRDGYAPMHWKSNVKLANAQASGTPIICARESGYLETLGDGGAVFIDDAAELGPALDGLVPVERRTELADQLFASRISVQAVAELYRPWLKEAMCCPA